MASLREQLLRGGAGGGVTISIPGRRAGRIPLLAFTMSVARPGRARPGRGGGSSARPGGEAPHLGGSLDQ